MALTCAAVLVFFRRSRVDTRFWHTALAPALAQIPLQLRFDALYHWLQAMVFATTDERGQWELAQFDALIDKNKRDFDTRLAKARVLMVGGDWTGAMDELLEIIMRDKKWNDEAQARFQRQSAIALGLDCTNHYAALGGLHKYQALADGGQAEGQCQGTNHQAHHGGHGSATECRVGGKHHAGYNQQPREACQRTNQYCYIHDLLLNSCYRGTAKTVASGPGYYSYCF